MKNLQKFEEFVNGIKSSKSSVINEQEDLQTETKQIKISFDIDWNENIGKVEQIVTLAMSPNSLGMYELASDIEKFTGLPKADAEKYDETPEDAFVYGMCNVMNGGKELFFWTNGARLAGAAKQNGMWPAILELVSHECVHLSRLILAKHVLEKEGSEDWVSDTWPTVGDDPEVNKIDEEAFATTEGFVVQQLTDEFLKMASAYIPELKNLI